MASGSTNKEHLGLDRDCLDRLSVIGVIGSSPGSVTKEQHTVLANLGNLIDGLLQVDLS